MFSRKVLDIDAPSVIARITRTIESQVRGTLRRRGVVVGLSGGVVSSVVAALLMLRRALKARFSETPVVAFPGLRSAANQASEPHALQRKAVG